MYTLTCIYKYSLALLHFRWTYIILQVISLQKAAQQGSVQNTATGAGCTVQYALPNNKAAKKKDQGVRLQQLLLISTS